MKILIITNLYPPNIVGGYEIACSDIVQVMQRIGHECFVVTGRIPTISVESERVLLETAISRSLSLHHSWGMNSKARNQHIVSLINLIKLLKAIHRYSPDVLYFFNCFGLGTAMANFAFFFAPQKTLFHFMGSSLFAYYPDNDSILRKIQTKILGWKTSRVSAIICSKFESDKLSRFSFRRAVVLHPFLTDIERIPKKTNYEILGTPKGVFVGQFLPHKGSLIVESALKEIKRLGSDVSLDVFTPQILGAKNNPKLESIRIVSGKKRSEILKSLHTYDFAIFPSVWDEPFGIAQLELMAAGLPVISSLRGGSSEVYDGTNLIRFDISEKEDLSKKILHVISSSSEYRNTVGGNARETVSTKFTEKYFQEHLTDFLGEIFDL